MAAGLSKRIILWLSFAATTFIFQLYFALQYERSSHWTQHADFWAHSAPISHQPNSRQLNTDNAIAIENRNAGTKEWKLSNPALQRQVEGYMSHTSVSAGQSILLFYNSRSNATVEMEVFRTGWYNGLGARKLAGPTLLDGVEQTVPAPDGYGMVACRWKDPFEVQTDSTWTTGVYLIRLTEQSTFTQAYTIFVVRNDTHKTPDITFQLPTNTYQAYNYWGGKSLYGWGSGLNVPWGSQSGDRARKVSYDRPYARSTNDNAAFGNGAGEYLTNVQPQFPNYGLNTSASWNYNMVRWLERNGLDVSYVTNVDTHDRLHELQHKPKVFLTQGHDEYWSNAMRDTVERLRDESLVHLMFLGSNTAYFMVRMEQPIDSQSSSLVAFNSTSHPNLAPRESRVIACFKRKNADPNKHELSVPARQYRPEGELIGVEYVGDPYETDLIVKTASHWMFRNTQVVSGHVIPGLLGYEVDTAFDSKRQDRNVTILFETKVANRQKKRSGDTLLCHSTIYTTDAGVNVFGAGSMYWSWGLDDYGVVEGLRGSLLSGIVDGMTWNFLEAAGIKR